MKLRVSQMVEGEHQFHFESGKDAWMGEVLRRVEKQGYRLTGPLDIDLSVTKLEPDYYLRGRLGFPVEQNCARCAEAFPLKVEHSFEIAMAHIGDGRARKVTLSDESDELDIGFFEGNEIELSPVIEEQFFLSIPYQSLCQESCKGICQQCGQNRNVGNCACGAARSLNPFSVLDKLKN